MESDTFVKSPAFQIYPADFLSDKNTLVMTTQEIGAYWLLLLVCWQENGLPDDLQEMAVIARLPIRQFTATWERRIRRCFIQREDGRWTHKRLEKERQKQSENREKRQRAGLKGAEKRWQTDSNAIAMPCTPPNNSSKFAIAKNSLSDFSFQSSTSVADDSDPLQHFAVLEYHTVLNPEPSLAIQQCEVIAASVDDSPLHRAVWSEVLRLFKGNDYQRRHAGNAVDRFNQELQKIADGKRESPIASLPQRTQTIRERMGA